MLTKEDKPRLLREGLVGSSAGILIFTLVMYAHKSSMFIEKGYSTVVPMSLYDSIYLAMDQGLIKSGFLRMGFVCAAV